MSRGQYWLPGMRWGQRMQDGVVVDAMVGALTDPFDACHMGVTAENVATDYGVSRADQDALAVESHRRAAAAADAGYFTEQITPVEVPGRKGTVTIDTDEHVRPGVHARRPGAAAAGVRRATARSPPATPRGSTTPRPRSCWPTRRSRTGTAISPLGRLVAYAHAGVEPRIMGMGPVPAMRKVLERAGLKLDDIDLFEVNEAFAAQALAVVRELGLPPDRTNPNGSGVSLGHPIGATGAILAVKALYELRRTGGRYALVTMCIGGGQGIAAIFERASDGPGSRKRAQRHMAGAGEDLGRQHREVTVSAQEPAWQTAGGQRGPWP